MRKILFTLTVFLLLSVSCAAYAQTAENNMALGPGVYKGTAKNQYTDGQVIGLDPAWKYAEFSEICTGGAVMYRARENRREKTVAVNAGHGTSGGASRKTFSHPDQSPKVTGGTTAKGAVYSTAVSGGMVFSDGTRESEATLQMARILRDRLLQEGYDVLMIRDGEDVQLDNVARTVIASNAADVHIALHWDGDGLSYDKGIFYMSVPDELKQMEPVKSRWEEHERLGSCLIAGLEEKVPGVRIFSSTGHGSMDMDLTQTSYSTVPSVDIELGNQCSDHGKKTLEANAEGLVCGINLFFEEK